MTEDVILRAGLDSTGFKKGADDVTRSLDQMSRGSKKTQQEFQQFEGTFARLRQASFQLQSVLAGLGVALSVGKIVAVNKEYERLGAQLETVAGSASAARGVFAVLSEFANRTPFELADVTEAYIQLKARGIDPGIEAITAFGNIAASMGRSIQDAVRAVGAAAVGETEALKSFGIQAVQAGDSVIFNFRGAATVVRRNAEDIAGYLKKIGLEEYAGATERQAKTLGGVFSTLADAVSENIRQFGDGGFNDALRQTVLYLVRASDESNKLSRALGEIAGGVLKNITDLLNRFNMEVQAVVTGFAVLIAAFAAFKTAGLVVGAFAALANPIGLLALAIGAAASAAIYFADTVVDIGDVPMTVLEALTLAWEGITGSIRTAASSVVDFVRESELLSGVFSRLGAELREVVRIASAPARALFGSLESGAALRVSTPGSPDGGPGAAGTMTERLEELRQRRAAKEIQDSIKRAADKEAADQAFKPNERGLSIQTTQVLQELEKEAKLIGLVGVARDRAQKLQQAQLLSTDKLNAKEAETRVRIIELVDALAAEKRAMELRERAIQIATNNAYPEALQRGAQAVAELEAREKARIASLREGINEEQEYRSQLALTLSSQRKAAGEKLVEIEREIAATGKLAEAAAVSEDAERRQTARNQAMAEGAKNAAINVDVLTEALYRQAVGEKVLDAARVQRELKRDIAQQQRELELIREMPLRFNELALAIEHDQRALEAFRKEQDLLRQGVGAEEAKRLAREWADVGDQIDRARQAAERQRQQAEKSDAMIGLRRGLRQYGDEATDVAGQVERAMVKSFQSAEDALVSFVRTGKSDFKSLVNSILDDLARLFIKQGLGSIANSLSGFLGGQQGAGNTVIPGYVDKPQQSGFASFYGIASSIGGMLSSAFSGGMGSMFGATNLGAQFGGGVGGLFSASSGYNPGSTFFGAMPFARGGAFQGGRVRAFASGGIVDRPTTFPMADGYMGLMGERGPEAIVPLKEMADGSLGIRMQGGGRPVVQNINFAVKDYDSFRKSRQQVATTVYLAAERGRKSQ